MAPMIAWTKKSPQTRWPTKARAGLYNNPYYGIVSAATGQRLLAATHRDDVVDAVERLSVLHRRSTELHYDHFVSRQRGQTTSNIGSPTATTRISNGSPILQ